MTQVLRYAGEGTFSDAGDFDWDGPEPGARCRFILFVAQASAAPKPLSALQEAARYGFVDIELEEGELVVAETLQSAQLQVFAPYYEGALQEGSSLVCLPNWRESEA